MSECDLVAYGLVRQHFHVLYDVVAAEAGAVVKTVGDVVMTTFPTPDRALTAALRMRKEMARINSERNNEDLILKFSLISFRGARATAWQRAGPEDVSPAAQPSPSLLIGGTRAPFFTTRLSAFTNCS